MGIEAGSTNRWKTARERNRLKARYLIQSRVISQVSKNNDEIGACSSQLYDGENDDARVASGCCGNAACTNEVGIDDKPLTLEEMNITLRFLQAIIKNDLSAFSVAQLAQHGHLLNNPLPADIHALPNDDTGVDLSGGIPKEGARTLQEASYACHMMLSTIFPWELTKNPSTGEIVHKDSKLFNLQPQPTTLATSKYGQDYVTNRLVPYMERLRRYKQRQLTVIEYASLLGRHGIVALLLLGGLDPTKRHINCETQDETAGVASRRVLSLFHSVGNQEGRVSKDDGASCVIPLSIWSYILRAVIEIRMNSLLGTTGKDYQERTICNFCQHQTESLCFGSPCNHTFCETCMWNHLVDHVPSCTDLNRNVVTCPMCDAEFEGFQYSGVDANHQRQERDDQHRKTLASDRIPEEKKDGDDNISINMLSINDTESDSESRQLHIPSSDVRGQRLRESLAKFKKLPENKSELKSHKKSKQKRNRDAAHDTWKDALQPIIEGKQTKDIRVDRFFRAALTSPHLVIAYIEAGIDLNVRNEYGQTALYLACWKGSALVVQLLLENGADAGIAANGGSTCYSVATKYHRSDVLHLLEKYSGTGRSCTSDICAMIKHEQSPPEYEISMLIDAAADHPGAGACIIDKALNEEQLQQLEQLWQLLPLADACDDAEKTTKEAKSTYRPSRSYFCDAEKNVQAMLEGCVQAAREASSSSEKSEMTSSPDQSSHDKMPTSVFQHIRFLNYERPGGVLPAHVDLCRVDESSGLRSTHTFILYMTNCEKGGGTALLKHLKDPEVLAIAQPKRGRVLLFPHLCPHSGLEVECAPKLLLRGEVILD